MPWIFSLECAERGENLGFLDKQSWRNTGDLEKAPTPWSTEQYHLLAGRQRDWISANSPTGRNWTRAPGTQSPRGVSAPTCPGLHCLFQRDNQQWLECWCHCGRGDGCGVEQVPLVCFGFPPGRGFCRTLHCHLNQDILTVIVLVWGKAAVTLRLLSSFSSSTQIWFISLFFCTCLLSLFPCLDFPSAKPWNCSARSQGHYPNPTSARGTFPSSLSWPSRARCCTCSLEPLRSLLSLLYRSKTPLELQLQQLSRGWVPWGCTEHVVLLLSGRAGLLIGAAPVYTVCWDCSLLVATCLVV